MPAKPNPRRANGSRRDKARARVLAAYDVCALCGHMVDQSLRTPHEMSAEVDEIIPVSKGGSPFDFSNLQLTHRVCNRLRGDGTRHRVPRSAGMRTGRDW